jgi:recombination DNA repair RAD52 pathway protein
MQAKSITYSDASSGNRTRNASNELNYKCKSYSNDLIVILFLFSLDKKGNAQVAEEKPVKHVRMEQSSSTTPNITPVSAAAAAAANNQIPPSPKPKPKDDDSKRRIVSMEQSVHTFAGTSSTRRDRSDPVMITDALSDVRVK